MRLRRCCLVLLLSLLPTAAHAHGHVADVMFALAWANGSNLWGFRETYGIALPSTGVKHWTAVGDIGILFGEHNDENVAQLGFTGGIRRTFARSTETKNLLFAQFLLGAMHTRTTAENPTDFAVGFGAGYEYAPPDRAVAVRVQFDYLRSGERNFPGVSVGIVHRFNP